MSWKRGTVSHSRDVRFSPKEMDSAALPRLVIIRRLRSFILVAKRSLVGTSIILRMYSPDVIDTEAIRR
jgi:hypothetical protein